MADPKGRHGFGVAPLSPDFLTELFQDPLDPGYADAAARRAQGRTRPPWQRRGLRTLTLITLVVVGMLLGVAYRHVLAEEPDRTRARAELVERIHQREAEVERLREISDGLRDDVSRLRDLALDDSDVRRLRELEALTGLARVTGDGVVVQVADGPPVLNPTSGEMVTDPESRILDQDLQRITNTLWASGAEAIAINNHRLTATSTIRNASGAILVDYVPVAGPYEVVAIGPGDLEDRFAASETAALMRMLADRYGISYNLHSERDLVLPASGEPKLHYAKPMETAPAAPSPAPSGGD